MNITDTLRSHAAFRPNHPAIIDGPRTLCYAALDAAVDAAAANLQAAGIAPGDIVGVSMRDSADHLIVLLALARAGAVMVAVDITLPAAEQRQAAEAAGIAALIADEGAAGIGGVRRVAAEAVCREAEAAFVAPLLGPDHPLTIGQSSGTTGAPKSFLWSHARMQVQAPRHARCLDLSWRDRYLAVIRMGSFWQRELIFVLLCLGATIVVNRRPFPAETAAVAAAQRITLMALNPAQIVALLDLPEGPAPLFPSLRAMIVGSAPLAHERRLAIRRRLTPEFHEQLGTNEAGLLILGTPADQDARPQAIGRVVPGVEARVTGPDGRALPPGEVGLIGFRGEGMPTAYLGDPAATARAFRDGWFHPGDLAALDGEGYVTFKGRADDVINTGGRKFYPVEVEKVLLAHPDVAEAAVLGWPHERLGEVAVAALVGPAPAALPALGALCRRRIAGYKIPHWVALLPELPKNAAGKILKAPLRRILGDLHARGQCHGL